MKSINPISRTLCLIIFSLSGLVAFGSAKQNSATSTLIEFDELFQSTHAKAVSLLNSDNECSRFFGGTGAIEPLNKLSRQLKKKALNSKVGIEMKGRATNYLNARTGFSYRLFDRSVVNSDGPFYRSGCTASMPCMTKVGRFEPSPGEARLLMLMHELAHLVRGADGQWLIPDDGNNPLVSEENTWRIQKVCGADIRRIAADRKLPERSNDPII
jgi:hypothetical protein